VTTEGVARKRLDGGRLRELAARLRFPRDGGPARAALVGALLLVLTWARLPGAPSTGFDVSWSAALHMGANADLAWGRDLIFTYGPLGFLKVPVYWYDGTGRLAVLYAFVTTFALLAVLWALSRRSFGPVGTFLLLFVIARDLGDPMQVLPFAVALFMLLSARSDTEWTVYAAGAGALAALESLGKVNTGALGFALAAVAILAQPRRARLAAYFAGAFVVSLVALWLAAGQPFTALPGYARDVARVVSGYSSGMALEDASRTWQYSAVVFTVLAGAAGVWLATELRPARIRAAALAIWLVFNFMLFKEGFVRHDGHEVVYFSTLVGAMVAIPWGGGRRALAGLVAVALPLLALMATINQRVDRLITPRASLSASVDDFRTIFSSSERAAQRERGRAAMVAALGLSPSMLALLQGHTVAVEPSETSAAWAYRLHWRPLPVMHSNVAYTRSLDEADADALSGPDAPERILWRREPSLDRRLQTFDPPLTRRTMLCRYSPLGSPQPPWLVLGRGANRCGAERAIRSVSAPAGESVPVPAPTDPNAMVIVRIRGAGVGGLELIRSLLFKARFRWVVLDGRKTYRLVPGTAEDGLVLRAPPGGDYPGPFTFAPNARQIAVRVDGGGGELRYEFSQVPMTAPPQ
jgi:hypothetical protein